MEATRRTALRVLRLTGVVTLLVSTASLLFRDWHVLGSAPFYVQLLATTVLLAGAGIACGLWLREAKGARTFLGIALATIPFNFAALGGVLLAASEGHGAPVGVALGTAAGSVLVLGAVTFLSLAALARPHARALGAALLTACGVLLVPVRDSSFVLPALSLGLLAVSIHDRLHLRSSTALRTLEGRIARAMVYVPFVLLAGRTLVYYDVTVSFLLTLLASAAWLLWSFSAHCESRQVRIALQVLSLGPAGLACVTLPWAVEITHAWAIVVIALSFGLTATVMGFFAEAGRDGFYGVAAMAGAAGTAVALVVEPGTAMVTVAVATGATTLAGGYLARHAIAFLAGTTLSALAVGTQLVQWGSLEVLTGWPALAALGTAAILGASVMERHGAKLVALLTRLRSRFSADPDAGRV